jgi:hypothetical protein
LEVALKEVFEAADKVLAECWVIKFNLSITLHWQLRIKVLCSTYVGACKYKVYLHTVWFIFQKR